MNVVRRTMPPPQGPGENAAAQYTPPQGLKYPQPVNDPTPDWDEVRQEHPAEYKLNEIPVCIKNTPTVYPMPAKRASMTTISVVNSPVELIPADPRLKRAWISAGNNGVVVGTREQVVSVNSAQGFALPAGQPMPWEGFEEAVYGINPGGTVLVSMRYEYWAD